MLKECRVVALPTEDISNIYKFDGKLIYSKEGADPHVTSPYHLYIACNDEIKAGDWYTDGKEITGLAIDKYYDYSNYNKLYGKIIASTDPKMTIKTIDYALPAISQKVIKKYCDVDGFEKILVHYYDNLVVTSQGCVCVEFWDQIKLKKC